jgi:VanZ family protein
MLKEETKKKLINFSKYWLPVIIWALIIFKLSSGIVPQVSNLYWPNFAFMKTAHVVFFGVLAALLYRALRSEGISRKKAAIWSVVITMLYGASDELHQFFTQGREAKLRDIGFDTIGGAVAVLIVYKLFPKLPKKYLKKAEDLGFI